MEALVIESICLKFGSHLNGNRKTLHSAHIHIPENCQRPSVSSVGNATASLDPLVALIEFGPALEALMKFTHHAAGNSPFNARCHHFGENLNLKSKVLFVQRLNFISGWWDDEMTNAVSLNGIHKRASRAWLETLGVSVMEVCIRWSKRLGG